MDSEVNHQEFEVVIRPISKVAMFITWVKRGILAIACMYCSDQVVKNENFVTLRLTTHEFISRQRLIVFCFIDDFQQTGSSV